MTETSDEFEKAKLTEDAFDQASKRGDAFDQAAAQGGAGLGAPEVQQQEVAPEVPTPEQPPAAVVGKESGGGDTGEEIYDDKGELIAKPGEPAPKDAESGDDDEPPGMAEELLMGIPRGVASAAENVYDYLDYASGDRLWDWNRDKHSWVGESTTTAGKIGESLVQFGVGFIPGLGALSLLGKASKIGKLGVALSKSKDALKTFSAGKLSLAPSTMKKMSKLKTITKTNVKFAVAGFMSEFLVFKGQEERLANLLTTHGEEGNAFIEWLAYNPDAVESEHMERFKRALEGLVVGEVMGLGVLGAAKGLGKAFAPLKPKLPGEVNLPSVMDFPEKEEALSGLQKIFSVFRDKNKRTTERRIKGEEADEFEAVNEALSNPENILTQNEKNAVASVEKRIKDRKNKDAYEAQSGEKLNKNNRPEGVKGAEENMAGAEKPKVKRIKPDKASEKQLDDWFLEQGISAVKMSLKEKRAYAKDMLKESKAGGTEHLIKSVEQHVVKVVKDAGLYDTTNPQAMLSGVRVLNSVTEIRAFLGHMAKVALKASRKASPNAKASAEFYEKTKKLIGMGTEGAGGKRGDIDLEPFRYRVEDLEQVRVEADALYEGMNVVGRDIAEKVKNARTAMKQDYVTVKVNGKDRAMNQDEAMTEVYSAMDRFTALQEIWADFGTQMSLGLRQRQDLYRTGHSSLGRDIAGQHRTLGVAVDDAMKTSGKLFRRANNKGVSDARIVKDLEKLFKKSGMEVNNMDELAKSFNQVGVNNALSRYALVGRKGLAISQEWYYNAILGAPTSWVVNFLGGALVQPLRHIESIAGGVATGNVNLVKANFRVMFDLQSFGDAARYAWKSGVDDEARSITGHTAFRDDRLHTPKGEIHANNPNGNAIASAYNFIGHIVRHPSRVMMMGDEFFKQLSFRSRVKTSLAMDGYKKGLHRDPGKLAQHIDDGLKATITKDGRFRNEENVRREALEALVKARKTGADTSDERGFIKDYMDDHFFNNQLKIEDGTIYSERGFTERQMLVESGKDWALVNTFTNEVTNTFFKKTGEIAQMSPWLGFIIPFVRTPSNIILFALGRTLPNPVKAGREIMESVATGKAAKGLGVDNLKGIDETPEARKMAQNLLDTIQNESSIKAAEAIGRLSTGVMTMGTLFMHIETLRDRITGSAPADPGKRAAWEATGKRANSIKFGDKWHSYQRLDPFATTLGIMADITHGWEEMRDTGVSEFGGEEEFEAKQDNFMQVCGILATAFANNTMKKSYIENLGELLDLMEKPAETFSDVLGNVAGGFVPNGLNWSQNVFQEEPAILEARGLLDKMRKRLPEFMRPGEKIMPQRNGFGEVRRKSKDNTGDLRKEPMALLKGMWPIFSSETSNDIVDIETENHGVGRKPMQDGRNIGGKRISYRSYKNELGDTAYDRMQELSGTMKMGPNQLTLRQALRATIESNDYQNLPPVTESNRHKDHPRTKELTRIMNIYKAEARRKTESEFPQLKSDLAKLL